MLILWEIGVMGHVRSWYIRYFMESTNSSYEMMMEEYLQL